jgi:transcriptional regulator with XRE-family HTH domain
VLRALKPKGIIIEPHTFAEHMKKRRQELALSQRAVAELLGVTPFTVLNWENGNTTPRVEAMPAIIGFLGYDPSGAVTTLSAQMAELRRANGWTIKRAAEQLGVDEGTWGRWEKTGVPWKRYQEIVSTFLKGKGTAVKRR